MTPFRTTLLVLAASTLVACGSSGSGPPTGPDTSPPPGERPPAGVRAWGFFAYTADFLGGLSHARQGRATGVLWTEIEPRPGSGSYEWGALDARVGNAQAAGVNAVLVLKASNDLAFSEPGCFAAVEVADARGELPAGRESASCPVRADMEEPWSRMVAELVERYDADGVRDMPGLSGAIRVDVQVENEAASRQYWDFGETDRARAAERYLRLLELAYRAKEHSDPGTQVILSGLIHPNLLARCDADASDPRCTAYQLQNVAFTRRVLARPDAFDAIDVHFFVYYRFEPGYIDEGVQWVASRMQELGYDRPIYSLEWTGSMLLHVNEGFVDQFAAYFPYSGDFPVPGSFEQMYRNLGAPENLLYRQWFEREQATEFGKLFTNLLALGVGRLVHVQYSDFPGGPWDNPWWNWQGVVKYVEGQPIRKPSYYTFNILSERLFGFTGARRLGAGGEVRLYEFTLPAGQPTLVLWTDGDAGVVDLSPAIAAPQLRLTHLVTELDGAGQPVTLPDQTVPVNAVPVSAVPVLLSGVG